MARPLRTDPPSSSVASLLDSSAAVRATTREVSPPAGPAPSAIPSHRESTSPSAALIKREFILTPETNATLDQLIYLYRRGTRTRLSASHVLRAMLRMTGETLDALGAELLLMRPMKLPSNAHDHDHERERFEQVLSDLLRAALRRKFVA